jgi:hypothetical protein
MRGWILPIVGTLIGVGIVVIVGLLISGNGDDLVFFIH